MMPHPYIHVADKSCPGCGGRVEAVVFRLPVEGMMWACRSYADRYAQMLDRFGPPAQDEILRAALRQLPGAYRKAREALRRGDPGPLREYRRIASAHARIRRKAGLRIHRTRGPSRELAAL